MKQTDEVVVDQTAEGKTKYRHNALEGFGNGCLLDLRVRIAIDLLKTSPIFHGAVQADESAAPASYCAGFALDVADALLSLSDQLGLIDPIPTEDRINPQLRAQAGRTAHYSALQQMAMQKIGEEESGRILPGVAASQLSRGH